MDTTVFLLEVCDNEPTHIKPYQAIMAFSDQHAAEVERGKMQGGQDVLWKNYRIREVPLR